MPIFSFICPSCGHRFEALMSSDQVKDAVCEKCAQPVQREWKGQFLYHKTSGAESGECPMHCPGCCKSHER